MAEEDPNTLLHPKPRRPFDLTPTSTDSSPQTPATPSRDHSSSSRAEPDSEKPASRTKSVLNLTSSTLFGIYAPQDYDSSRTEPPTPGTQTPLPRAHVDDKKPPSIGPFEGSRLQKTPLAHHPYSVQKYLLSLGLRTILLFLFGVAYGVIISHLHDSQQVQVAPVRIQSLERGYSYLLGWGVIGVVLGGLLPWVDIVWEEILGINGDVHSPGIGRNDLRPSSSSDEDDRPTSRSRSGLDADWIPVVRSIGAFVGIAFAIRKLPWQSTLQVSLTLALVNPVLWYLIDRSKPGFLLSMLVGIAGTAIAFGVNPEIVPSPAAPSPRVGMHNVSYDTGLGGALISNESIGVGTWIASVLFCSSVCFGNIGRRLALNKPSRSSCIP